jgi:NAD(P)-dependent dehydrogenase (short-subunit alcohol dehydrogenase family)
MSSPVVLITGALTGIGRAAAIIFPQKEHALLFLGVETNKGKS